MDRQYTLRKAAINDIKEIARYTQKKWNVAQRDRYLRDSEKRFEWLTLVPEAGVKRDDIKLGYRCYPHKEHHIFYIIDRRYLSVFTITVNLSSIDVIQLLR